MAHSMPILIKCMFSRFFAVGMIRVTEEESKRLVRPASKIPNTDEYLIELKVFHQLHYLNQIQRAFYPKRWPHLWQYTQRTTPADSTAIGVSRIIVTRVVNVADLPWISRLIG